MKCKCCNSELNDVELNYRDPLTDQYLDTCKDCLEEQGSSLVQDEDIDDLQDIGIDL